jgi:aryl-alcohol dehydrogenase-like predicted oxidoreductase
MANITGNMKTFSPIGLGCWQYHSDLWGADQGKALLETMESALAHGIDHFDTATGYGSGASEKLVGRYLQGRRSQVFLATKAGIQDENPHTMLASVKASLERLNTDYIDLYYIHWPRSDMDIRPAMEGLELARVQGLVRAVGVSNFSVAQMEQVSQVGKIDAHQIPHSLLWRLPELEVIPYCRQRGIGVIAYGAMGYGILTGKFGRKPFFQPEDDRSHKILFFQEPTWGAIHNAVEQMKAVAQEVHRPLQHLALRWSLAQPGMVCALAGANNPAQASQNAAALQGEVPAWALERLTEISAALNKEIPAEANPYRFTP